MVIRFRLRDLHGGHLPAVGGLLGTFCLTPKGYYAVTMMLLPAAAPAGTSSRMIGLAAGLPELLVHWRCFFS